VNESSALPLRIDGQTNSATAARLLDVGSSNAPTVFGNVATHKKDMRDGPPARLAADDVCSPDATFCDLRKPMGNGLLLGIGHLLEEDVRTSIIGQPLTSGRVTSCAGWRTGAEHECTEASRVRLPACSSDC
jgi:hypothetical protein